MSILSTAVRSSSWRRPPRFLRSLTPSRPRRPSASAPERAPALATRATRLALVLALAAPGLPAQTGDPAAQAQALIQAGRFAEAADVLRPLAQANPGAPQPWFLLGYALHADGRFEEALEAHTTAASFPAIASSAAYNAACAAARLSRPDEAFAWIDTALAAGFTNLAQLRADGDLASLVDDPRYARFGTPDAAQAGALFVEGADVLHLWEGESANGEFGWIARNIGDVDGDGADDVGTSAPYHLGAGRIYAYSGRGGALLWTHDGRPGDTLGLGIEAGGDVDGDGVPDVVVGAPRKDGAPGRVEVLSGVDGALLATLSVGEANDGFGTQAVGCGDLDGDGHGEVLVGAPRADVVVDGQTLTDAGRAYLCSGADGHVLATVDGRVANAGVGSTVASAADGRGAALMVGATGPNGGAVSVHRYVDGVLQQRFAWSGPPSAKGYGAMFLSQVGDVDADGTPDLYVSDWMDAALGGTTGRCEVRSGVDGRLLHALGGSGPGQGFGIGTGRAGDVDGDGHDDLIVGSWVYPAAAARGGRATLISGRTGDELATWTCAVPGDTFGFDTDTLGDVDGDGRIELLITSAESSAAAPKAGRVLVLSVPASVARPDGDD